MKITHLDMKESLHYGSLISYLLSRKNLIDVFDCIRSKVNLIWGNR
jgi:hypothetical protein